MVTDDFTDDEPTDSTASWDDRVTSSRRSVLRAAAAAGFVVGGGLPTLAQEETIELGGDTPGWEGRSPQEIEGETNPTLTLEEGVTYVVEWENVDGEPHNFAIEDADGNDLIETEVISERGATQTVEFEATRAMSEYYCPVHPTSMRGEIDIGAETDEEDEAATADGQSEGFFPEGPSVGVQTVADGMTAPTDFATPDGDDRLFVADQTGELWVVDDDGRREEPFLDVSDEMVDIGEDFAGGYADPEQDYDERGLLGVEFHPEFQDNGRFFVHYSAPPDDDTPDGWSHVEVVSEFEHPEDAESADPDSEEILLEFQKPQYNHDSGPMAFGPDGYLYVPMGDGGGANDNMYGHVDDWYDENEGGNGQDVTENLLGSVLRIDVDDVDDDEPYGIPDDNPLVDEDGLDEYYAWGFRNPFGISFDEDGRMFVADAGQALFEEANIVERGGNYGWNVKEGTHCFSTDNPGDPPEDCPDQTPEDVRGGEELIDPIVEYPHTYRGEQVGIVIVGGHFYEGATVEELDGKYIFGEWTRDVARAMPEGRLLAATDPDFAGDQQGDGEATDDTMDDADADPSETVPRDELWDMEELMIEGSEDGELHRFVRQFGRDDDGEVYVLVNARGVPEGDTGAVLQLVPSGEGEELEPPEMPEDAEADDQEADDDDEEEDDEETVDDDDGDEVDSGNETDAGNETDTGNETDGGNATDTGNETDTGNDTDADNGTAIGDGNESDSGNQTGNETGS